VVGVLGVVVVVVVGVVAVVSGVHPVKSFQSFLTESHQDFSVSKKAITLINLFKIKQHRDRGGLVPYLKIKRRFLYKHSWSLIIFLFAP